MTETQNKLNGTVYRLCWSKKSFILIGICIAQPNHLPVVLSPSQPPHALASVFHFSPHETSSSEQQWLVLCNYPPLCNAAVRHPIHCFV